MPPKAPIFFSSFPLSPRLCVETPARTQEAIIGYAPERARPNDFSSRNRFLHRIPWETTRTGGIQRVEVCLGGRYETGLVINTRKVTGRTRNQSELMTKNVWLAGRIIKQL